MLGCPLRDKCFVRFSFSRIHFSNLSSWNNHIFNELKQRNYEIGRAILPRRYRNTKCPIRSLMFSLAHFHSLDIFHLLSVNPLTMLKGQLERRVSEHSKDSLFAIPPPSPTSSSSSSRFIKQAALPIKVQLFKPTRTAVAQIEVP